MNRIVRNVMPVLALLVAGGAAACTTAPGSGGATPTPTATPAATCPAGAWRSTGVAANANVSGVPVTVTGGADVTLTIGADSAVKADFTAMKPVVYTATVAGTQITGEFTYQGAIDGKVDTTGTASSTTTSTGTTTSSTGTTATSAATGSSGPWRPVGPVNWNDLRLTVKLTKPLALTVIDNVKIADVTGSQTAQAGNVLDLQPLLRSGDYRCAGNDTLIITPSAAGGPTVAWTLTRV